MTRKYDKNKLYIGILSGTSMDSIDCGIYKYNKKKWELLAFYENNYPSNIKNKITKNYDSLKSNYIKSTLNKKLSQKYAKIINNILSKEGINSSEITAIGMHGQTISHGKIKNKNFSIQLGCPNTLSIETNIKVVSNFRQDDIDNEGQGAPLAPLYHKFIFNKFNKNMVVVNIGGISNITFMKDSRIYGFDSGPGNTLLDTWMKKNFNKDYDKNGSTSKKFNIQEDLLNFFLKDKYFNLALPKSTSTEYFCHAWILNKLNKMKSSYSSGDILATLTKLTSSSIVSNIKNNIYKCDKIYICGGGAYNKSIISGIKYEATNKISKNISIESTSKVNINPKSVETGLFAWLAMSRIENIKLNYSKITGSKKPKILGRIYLPR